MVDGSVVLEVEGAAAASKAATAHCIIVSFCHTMAMPPPRRSALWFIRIRHLCSRYNLLDPLQVLAAPPHQDLVVPAPPGSLQGSGPVEVSCLKNHRQ